jgi:hypothetical protein
MEHNHKFNINDDGYGETVPEEGIDHIHIVIGYEVIPAADGHSHSIELPEGWESGG